MELVEIGLPRLEPVIRVAIFAVAVPKECTIPKWLPWKLDQQFAVLFP
jgi:hypothetical protein